MVDEDWAAVEKGVRVILIECEIGWWNRWINSAKARYWRREEITVEYYIIELIKIQGVIGAAWWKEGAWQLFLATKIAKPEYIQLKSKTKVIGVGSYLPKLISKSWDKYSKCKDTFALERPWGAQEGKWSQWPYEKKAERVAGWAGKHL